MLGPAKTYILRGTPQTYAIKIRAVTDNMTMKKGPCKGNGGPRKGNRWAPVTGTEGPVTGTGRLLIARNPFKCTRSCYASYGFNCRAARGSLRKAHLIGLGRTLGICKQL